MIPELQLQKLIEYSLFQGFLTDSGNVNLDRVQLIMADLGDVEDEIFKKRQQNEIAFKERERAKKRRTKMLNQWQPAWVPQGQFAPQVSVCYEIYV